MRFIGCCSVIKHHLPWLGVRQMSQRTLRPVLSQRLLQRHTFGMGSRPLVSSVVCFRERGDHSIGSIVIDRNTDHENVRSYHRAL